MGYYFLGYPNLGFREARPSLIYKWWLCDLTEIILPIVLSCNFFRSIQSFMP